MSACVVPLSQVIEFMADGMAAESFIPRSAQELGLHPRDVTLFAPLSRLAAPQVCVADVVGGGGGEPGGRQRQQQGVRQTCLSA